MQQAVICGARRGRSVQKRSALQEPRLAPKEASVCRAGPDSDEEEAKLLLPLLYLVDRVWFKDLQVIFLYSSADRKKNQSTHK